MILDICYKDTGPQQIQHVRKAVIYAQQLVGYSPELIIYFDDKSGQSNIPLADIVTVTVTND